MSCARRTRPTGPTSPACRPRRRPDRRNWNEPATPRWRKTGRRRSRNGGCRVTSDVVCSLTSCAAATSSCRRDVRHALLFLLCTYLTRCCSRWYSSLIRYWRQAVSDDTTCLHAKYFEIHTAFSCVIIINRPWAELIFQNLNCVHAHGQMTHAQMRDTSADRKEYHPRPLL